jgi:hypothetical protein
VPTTFKMVLPLTDKAMTSQSLDTSTQHLEVITTAWSPLPAIQLFQSPMMICSMVLGNMKSEITGDPNSNLTMGLRDISGISNSNRGSLAQHQNKSSLCQTSGPIPHRVRVQNRESWAGEGVAKIPA